MKTEITKYPKSPNENKNSSNNIFSIDSFHSDNFDYFNDIISKSPNKDENSKNQINSSLLLENIILILEKLVMTFKDEEKLLSTMLKEIYITINLIIKEYILDLKRKFDLNNNDINKFQNIKEENISDDIMDNNNDENDKNNDLDINSKLAYLFKIKSLNRTIFLLKEELDSLRKIFNNSDNELNQNKNKNNNFYKFILKKLKDLKIKSKFDEFKYLLYIQNQKKKIIDLEKELKIKQNENLPKEILKSIRCFPNFIQYNFKEDINPKSIPLFQMMNKKNNKLKPNKINNSVSYRNKNINNEINNSSIEKKRNNTKELSMNNKLKAYIKGIDKKKNQVLNIKNIKNNTTIIRNRNYGNGLSFDHSSDSDNIKTKFLTLNSGENYLTENSAEKHILDNNILKEVKEFNPKTIIDNKKKFFIAHPTLSIAGIAKEKEQAFSGLPKNLLKLNSGNFNGNKIIFPSSLNETMVNLEKLRSNRIKIDMIKKGSD